jgi:hypothetical protein
MNELELFAPGRQWRWQPQWSSDFSVDRMPVLSPSFKRVSSNPALIQQWCDASWANIFNECEQALHASKRNAELCWWCVCGSKFGWWTIRLSALGDYSDILLPTLLRSQQ